MPKYGMTMTEGTLTKWRKQPGEQVRKGDIIAEIGADKAEMEAEAETDGTILRLLIAEGETVPCGTPLCWIGQAGESVPD